MSRDEMLRRARIQRAVADYTRRHARAVPAYLDVCDRCGDAIDEPLGKLARRSFVCRRCALGLDDERRAAQ